MKLIKGGKNMIHLTYAQVRDPNFNPTIMGLLQSRMKFRAAKKIAKLAKAIRSEQMKSDDAWKEIVEKYLEPVQDAEGQTQGLKLKDTLSEDEVKEAHDVIDKFGATEIQLDQEKLKPFDLAGVDITPAELVRLECLIEDEI